MHTLPRRVRLPHNDDLVSLEDRLRLWASTKHVFGAITDGHLGVSPHGGFADLVRFIEACIRRGETVDGGPTRRRRHWSGPREDGVQSQTRARGVWW